MAKGRLVRARLEGDGTVSELLPGGAVRPLARRTDWSRVDATSEAEIARHAAEDEAAAARDAAAWARRVRRRVGLSQQAFAARIGVPLATVRNWELGKEAPSGAERAFLRVIDREPEAVLRALGQ